MVKRIVESCRKFGENISLHIARSSFISLSYIGITVKDKDPLIKYENGQGTIIDVRMLYSCYWLLPHSYTPQQLRNVGFAVKQSKGELPNLIFVVLPEGAGEIYTKVKQ